MLKKPTAQEIKDFLLEKGMSANEAEKKLKMGQGTLSKAMSGKRELPDKWIKPFLAMVVVKKAAEPVPVPKLPEVKEEPVKPAPNIDPPQESDSSFERLQSEHVVPQWIERMDEFCNEHNCTPDDVMEFYREKHVVYKKPGKEITSLLSEPKTKSETFFQKRQRENQGLL